MVGDGELQEQLMEAGKKLLKPPASIDDLLPLLDQVENCLSKVEQSPSKSMQDALSTLQKALVSCELFKHSEVDVKVAVASCISEITRISAPDAPYEDDVMKEVFQLIVSSFDTLSDKASRSYGKRVSILETVAKVRSCVVMLDLECDSLIIEMFRHFLKEIRDYHEDNVFQSMETIMTLVIDESEDISAELLCPVLDSVKKDEQAFPMAKRLGEKVLENCAKKLKPYLRQALKSFGAVSDDYSVIVASICEGLNGLVDQSDVHAVTDERSRQDVGPTSGGSENTIATNGLTLTDKSLADSNSLKKEEDGCNNLTFKEPDDANEGKNLDNEMVAKVELQPEQITNKTRRKPSSPVEASKSVNDSVIANQGLEKKENQQKDSSKDHPILQLEKDVDEPGLPGESRVETSMELSSPKTPQNESTDAALPNERDDLPTKSEGGEEGLSKQDEEEEEEEVVKVISNDLAEKKAEEKKDLAVEIDAAKEGGMSDDSSSEEKTLTAEDSAKDTEATSDSPAKRSNQLKKKVNAWPRKRTRMSGRMQEEREILKLPKERKDALKSSKNSDKKEMVPSLKNPGKDKQRAGETSKGSSKGKQLLGKEEDTGVKMHGAELVGSKIKVWWPMDKAFYEGRVVDFDAVTKKHRILYFDGDVEVLVLRKERWEVIKDDFADEDQAVEHDSSDASPKVPLKKAKLKPDQSMTKQGKMVSSSKQGGGLSSGKSKVGTATLTSRKSRDGSKADDGREDDTGGESSFHTPKSSNKAVDATSKKSSKSKDKDAGTSSKAAKPRGNISGLKNPPLIKSKHRIPESGSKSKSKQESKSSPTGTLPKSLGKSSNADDSDLIKLGSAKSEESEAMDEGSPNLLKVAVSSKRGKLFESSSKGKGGRSQRGKKRRRGA